MNDHSNPRGSGGNPWLAASLEALDPRFLTRLPHLETLTATFASGDEFPKNRCSDHPSPAGFSELLRVDRKDRVLRQQLWFG